MRKAGGWIVSTHFTLVPGKGGEPFISEHLKRLRPFLKRGDFVPGSFGHALVDALQPADLSVEKVAFSAFYQSRLEFVLRKAGIDTLVFAGIVTNGGVASTVRDAHVRDLRCIVLSDGCAAFSESVHAAAMADLGTVASIATCDAFVKHLGGDMSVLPAAGIVFDASVPVAVIGGGACGLIAALAAHDQGAEVVVFERDASPSGSTALSSGFIPAANTRYQRAKGIEDSPALLAADIQGKAHGLADPTVVDMVARGSGPTIEWLVDRHGLEFVLLEGFLYPGHSVLRMHAHPRKTGTALLAALLDAVARAGIDVVTNAHVVDLYADGDGRVRGFRVERPDGSGERIACDALVLACNGYGGNKEMVRRYIPEMADALYFGHVGNQGDAVKWGEALGGVAKHMGAYQGHGSVAHPHGVLVTWALMMEGGIQVNSRGPALLERASGLFRAGRRRARPAGPDRLEHLRRAAPCARPRVRRLSRGRGGRRGPTCGRPGGAGQRDRRAFRSPGRDLGRSRTLPSRRNAGSFRSRLHDKAASRAALLRGQGDGGAVPYAGRARHRRRRRASSTGMAGRCRTSLPAAAPPAARPVPRSRVISRAMAFYPP